MTAVAVVATGLANTASVVAALTRLGVEAEVTRDAARVDAARAVVLPGVGAFGAGMRELRSAGLVDSLIRRIEDGDPIAGVCLGLQLLCRTSDESPGETGLGVVDAHVGRFGSGLTVPQMGWNHVAAAASMRHVVDGYAYFANSYRLASAPDGWEAATAEYGGPFVAALERGNALACQFHPELSGAWGLGLLGRWLAAAGVRC
ncbi:MAG: imidazole glycerol phosphate synthase subunit HisH [Myxococcales bacterium]|nr:imidazole glycerol phosphate synthase subunit HisH [Myxococcales bacterium]